MLDELDNNQAILEQLNAGTALERNLKFRQNLEKQFNDLNLQFENLESLAGAKSSDPKILRAKLKKIKERTKVLINKGNIRNAKVLADYEADVTIIRQYELEVAQVVKGKFGITHLKGSGRLDGFADDIEDRVHNLGRSVRGRRKP